MERGDIVKRRLDRWAGIPLVGLAGCAKAVRHSFSPSFLRIRCAGAGRRPRYFATAPERPLRYLNLGFEYPDNAEPVLVNLPVADVLAVLRELGLEV
jgi:hypothetical protein